MCIENRNERQFIKNLRLCNFKQNVYDLIGAPCHIDKKKNFFVFLIMFGK